MPQILASGKMEIAKDKLSNSLVILTSHDKQIPGRHDDLLDIM